MTAETSLSRPPTRWSRWLRAVAAVVVVAVVASSGASVGAQSLEDKRAERREVQRRRAAAAAEIDALRADRAELVAALDVLNRQVAAEEARLADARRAADEAEQALRRAEAQVALTTERIADTRRRMRDIAVRTYIGGVDRSGLAVLSSEDAETAVRRQVYARVVVGDQADLADELVALGQDLEVARAEAADAARRAADAVAAVEAQVAEVQAARDRQAQLANEVAVRLERRLAEAAALAELDARLAESIRRDEEELARRAAATRVTVSAPTPVGNIRVVNVRGIVVNEQIADQVRGLLEAADADGISLGGSGYRDSRRQVALRRANCGSSDYAVYQAPPSSCRPPTARPGTSMHERGLAIDFTYNGRLITSRSSPGYRWLAANAGRFGLRNLPSEPWHWSTNGQ